MGFIVIPRMNRLGLTLLSRKNYSTTNNLVNVQQNNKTGTSIVTMNKQPANSFNNEFLVQLRESLKETMKNRSTAVILTSSLPKIFSSGLDLMKIYGIGKEESRVFWNEMQETWLTLYGLPMPVAAAINGACPAGGCFLAMACDYRVFVEGKHGIGLSETKVGMMAPKWFQTMYIDTIGYRNAELSLMRGDLFLPEEALKIGLVDKLATDKDDAIEKCQKYIKTLTEIPATGRTLMKQDFRSEKIAYFKKIREEDAKLVSENITHPEIQKSLGQFIEGLKKKN